MTLPLPRLRFFSPLKLKLQNRPNSKTRRFYLGENQTFESGVDIRMSRQNFNFRFSQKQRIVAAYTKIAMNDAGSITMTMRPPDRLKVIQAVVDGCLTESMTANWSQLTKR